MATSDDGHVCEHCGRSFDSVDGLVDHLSDAGALDAVVSGGGRVAVTDHDTEAGP